MIDITLNAELDSGTQERIDQMGLFYRRMWRESAITVDSLATRLLTALQERDTLRDEVPADPLALKRVCWAQSKARTIENICGGNYLRHHFKNWAPNNQGTTLYCVRCGVRNPRF